MALEFAKTLQKLADHEELTSDQISFSFEELTEGRLTQAQIAALLMGLKAKGETAAEITEIARHLRIKAHRITPKVKLLMDTCGTGGDGAQTFNISTAAAFVVAGAGIPVAKHGNRSVSSQCGSADVLEQLGINLELDPKAVEQVIEEIGIGFLFAPAFHPAMKYASAPRRELGVRTVFNVLGPLLNPAGATHQIVGVYDPRLTEVLALALSNLGVQAGMVVHGSGLDEITLSGATLINEFGNGKLKTYQITPEDFGFQRADLSRVQSQSPEEGAEILRDVLAGETGPPRDVVLLNAGAAVYISGKAQGFEEGIELAAESIDSRAAEHKLHSLIHASRREVSHGLLR
ncbi:anthranilate phosphoribosyltransferase [Candidatus Acetothermia bacterium]|nr:anthranilate phosphoribosyltransferase [Candidatus Acetothermia bacterium]MBI3642933.1 anthranilate phosphoribosyltransferase [Candidatus Acetothermia bacterium]